MFCVFMHGFVPLSGAHQMQLLVAMDDLTRFPLGLLTKKEGEADLGLIFGAIAELPGIDGKMLEKEAKALAALVKGDQAGNASWRRSQLIDQFSSLLHASRLFEASSDTPNGIASIAELKEKLDRAFEKDDKAATFDLVEAMLAQIRQKASGAPKGEENLSLLLEHPSPFVRDLTIQNAFLKGKVRFNVMRMLWAKQKELIDKNLQDPKEEIRVDAVDELFTFAKNGIQVAHDKLKELGFPSSHDDAVRDRAQLCLEILKSATSP